MRAILAMGVALMRLLRLLCMTMLGLLLCAAGPLSGGVAMERAVDWQELLRELQRLAKQVHEQKRDAGHEKMHPMRGFRLFRELPEK